MEECGLPFHFQTGSPIPATGSRPRFGNCALKDRVILPMNRKMRNRKPLAVVCESNSAPTPQPPREERDE